VTPRIAESSKILASAGMVFSPSTADSTDKAGVMIEREGDL
jgi:hypothetical protein